MNIAVTGGTGFMGSHLTQRLAEDGHQVVVISRGQDGRNRDRLDHEHVRFVETSVADEAGLAEAVAGCDAIAHLAGISFERGMQTFNAVHVEGTLNVLEAATKAGVSKVLLSSFLRARPNCGSAYHETKWTAERLVRRSGLDYTVCKIGVTYGQGDHLLSSLSRALSTAPVFANVGFASRPVVPLAIDDLLDVFVASLVDDRLSETTVPVVGPEELSLDELVGRIGAVVGTDPYVVPVPVTAHRLGARIQERILDVPLTSRAQVQMLAEGLAEPAPMTVCDPLPADLEPERSFTHKRIAASLPERDRFGLQDLRLPALLAR